MGYGADKNLFVLRQNIFPNQPYGRLALLITTDTGEPILPEYLNKVHAINSSSTTVNPDNKTCVCADSPDLNKQV